MTIACGVGALGGALLQVALSHGDRRGLDEMLQVRRDRVVLPSLFTGASGRFSHRVVLSVRCHGSARDGESRTQQSADKWRRTASITLGRKR